MHGVTKMNLSKASVVLLANSVSQGALQWHVVLNDLPTTAFAPQTRWL
jgi:hypothetical protein